MSVGETIITIAGNLTDDPEIRFTPSGAAMAKFTVASTPRTYDKTTGQWQDGTAMFLRCTAWRQLAEHVGDSLTKGMRIVAQGRLRQFNWENDQGEKRSMLTLEVDEIGPSLRFATAKVTKHTGRTATGPSADPWASAAPGKPPAASSWGSTPAAGANPWPTTTDKPTAAPAGSGGYSDEPPF